MIWLLLVWSAVARPPLWHLFQSGGIAAALQTNSRSATKRGIKEFKSNQDATHSFAEAHAIEQSPSTAFNLGTAQIAAGDREHGSQSLEQSMRDPALRADALYNRGTSALSANAYDAAIRDYIDALRLRPNDLAAKRNLEIALARKRAAEQSKNRSGANQQQPSPQQKQSAAQQPNPKSDPNVDALLRSVQEQEKEELTRMHRGKGEKSHVGW